MNKKSEMRLGIYRKSMSILMVICLIFGILPRIDLMNVKAAATVPEDPLKDYVFDESNVAIIDLSKGAYISITENGYYQWATSNMSNAVLKPHTGNYTISGTSSAKINISIVSGDADIKLKDIVSIENVIDINISVSVNFIIDENVEISALNILSNKIDIEYVNIKGVDTSRVKLSSALSVNSTFFGGQPTNISLSNLKYSGRVILTAKKEVNVFNIDAIENKTTSGQPSGFSVNTEGNLNIQDFNAILTDKTKTPHEFTLYSGGTTNIYNLTIDNSIATTNGKFTATTSTSNTNLESKRILNNVKLLNILHIKDTGVGGSVMRNKVNENYELTTANSSGKFWRLGSSTDKYYSSSIMIKASGVKPTANGLSIGIDENPHYLYNSSYGGSYLTGEDMPYYFLNYSAVGENEEYIFPTVIRLKDYPNQYVTVKSDNWDTPSRLYTDKNGYIFPWLKEGTHSITITLDDKSTATVEVEVRKPELKVNYNAPSVNVTPSVPTNKQTIAVGLPNTEIKYGYDNSTWETATTDASGNVIIDVALNKSDFYVKTTQVPVTAFHAIITNDIVGTLTKVLTSIISQSVNSSYAIGDKMILYVNAKASDSSNTLSYQWFKGGAIIPNSDSNVLNQTVTADSFGTYMCKITENNGSSINSSNIVISKGSSMVPEDDYKTLQNLYNELQNKYNELKTNYDNLVTENNSNKELINTLRDKITELEQTIADLQQRITDKNGTIADLTKEVSDITNTVNTYKSLLEAIRTVLKVNTNDEIIPKIQEILAQLETLRKDNSDLTNDYNEFKDSTQATIDSLTEQIIILQEKVNDGKIELDEVKKQLSNALIKISDLRNLVYAIKAELGVTEDSEIIPAIQNLKNKYNDLKVLYDNLIIENNTNNTTIISLNERITQLESLITALEKDAQDKADTIKNLQDRVNELTSEVESYKSLIESIKTLLGANSNEEIIPKIQELLDDLSELHKDYEDLSQNYDDYKTEAQAKITELQERISSLEKELAEGSIELGVVKDQLAAALIQITDLRSLVDAIKAELGVTEDSDIIPAIQELKNKYNDLKVLYDNLIIENNTNITTIISLTERITKLETLITTLEKDAQEKADTIENLQDRVNELTSEVESYKSLIESIKTLLGATSNEEIIPKIQELLHDLSELQKDYENLSQSYDDYKTVSQEKITELQERISSLEKELADGSIELGVVKDQLAAALIQITDLNSLIDEIKRELGVDSNEEIIPAIQDLKRKYEELKINYDALLIENNTNSATIITLNERITKLESLITILEKDAQEKADTIENLQDRVNELTSEVESYKSLIESIKTLLGATSNEEIIPKIQELLHDLSELQKDYENLSQSYDDYKTVAQEKITELQERISSLEKELADGSIELGVVKDQLAAALIQITDLNSLIDEIKRELGVNSNEDIIPAIQGLKRKYEEIKVKYDALVLENNTNSTTIITLTERITELETIIIKLESDANVNSTTLKELQDRITELTVKITVYETLIDSIKVILEVTTDDEILPKIQEILKQLDNLSKDYEDLSDEYNEYKVNAINRIQELTLKITQLEQDITNKNIELDVVKRELADALAQITDLRLLVNDIKTELGVTDDTEIIPAIKALKDRIKGLENQVTELHEQLNSANDTIADLTKDMNDYNKRIEDMKDLVDADSSDDIESKIQDMKDLIAEYEEKITQLEKDKSDLEKVISDQQKEIQNLKDALKGNTQDLLDRISELEKKIKDLENRNTELSSHIDSLNQSISDLITENTELKKLVIELQTALDIANYTIEELRRKVIDLTVENVLIIDENTKLKAEIEELRNHVCPSNEDLLKEIETLKKEIENLKKNQTTNSSTVTVPDNSVVLTPTTKTENIIEQTNNKVGAESGWELNTSLNSEKWTNEIAMEDLIETTGTFTFFTGRDLAKAFSSYIEKTIVYARRKTDPNNVYVCSFVVDKGVDSYTSPSGTMSADTKGVAFVYDEGNTNVVNTTGKVTFSVDGNFGVAGKKGIYYKVVAIENDFDPDGSWVEIEGNSFTVEVDKQIRVYIKYVDNYGNYTVSKTTVLDSSKRLDVPVLQFNKTVYLGNNYKLQLDTKGNNVIYKSSDKLVATVDENGLVTAKYNGKAKINCTVFDKKGVLLYRYEVSVTVKESNDKTLSLKKNYTANGTNDVLLQAYKLISKGKTTKLNIKADKDAKVMYVTSDKAVATVNSKGIVTGKAKGSADITIVVYQNDKFYTYVFKVRVTDGTKDIDKEQYLK